MKYNLSFLEVLRAVDETRWGVIESELGDSYFVKNSRCGIVDDILKQHPMRYLCKWRLVCPYLVEDVPDVPEVPRPTLYDILFGPLCIR